MRGVPTAAAASAEGDADPSSGHGPPLRRARTRRRRKGAPQAGEAEGSSGSSTDSETESPASRAQSTLSPGAAGAEPSASSASMRAFNFNREYEPSGAHEPHSPLSPSAASVSKAKGSKPSELQIGVLPLGDDEEYNQTLLGPMRARNKGGMGLGTPVSAGGGGRPQHDWDGADEEEEEDPDGNLTEEELDAEQLRAFAFKGAAAAQVEQLDFEYELGELGARLGADLKILAAGFDEALTIAPYRQPLPSTYHAYNLGSYARLAYGAAPHAYGAGMGGFDASGTRRPSVMNMFGDDRHNFGSEYQPAPVPFSADELALQKAAAQRRRRKIVRELHWQRMKKEAKAAEKEAARRRAQHSAESSVNSKSGASSSGRHRHSRRPSSLLSPSADHSRFKRPGLNTRASTAAPGGTGAQSGAASAYGGRSTLASPQRPTFGQRG